MHTALPHSVHARLNAFLAMTLHEAADTDLDGVLASLQPAMGDLFEHTPPEAHDALTEALVLVAQRYDLADEVAGIALQCQRHAAGLDAESPEEEG